MKFLVLVKTVLIELKVDKVLSLFKF